MGRAGEKFNIVCMSQVCRPGPAPSLRFFVPSISILMPSKINRCMGDKELPEFYGGKRPSFPRVPIVHLQ